MPPSRTPRLDWADCERIACKGYERIRVYNTTATEALLSEDPPWEELSPTQRAGWHEVIRAIDTGESLDEFCNGYKNMGYPTAGEEIVEILKGAYYADRLEEIRPLSVPKGLQEGADGRLPRTDIHTLHAAQAAHRAFQEHLGGRQRTWDEDDPQTQTMCVEVAQAVCRGDARWLKEARDSCEGDAEDEQVLTVLEAAARSSLGGTVSTEGEEGDGEIDKIEAQAQLTVRAEHLAKVAVDHGATRARDDRLVWKNLPPESRADWITIATRVLRGRDLYKARERWRKGQRNTHVFDEMVEVLQDEARSKGWLPANTEAQAQLTVRAEHLAKVGHAAGGRAAGDIKRWDAVDTVARRVFILIADAVLTQDHELLQDLLAEATRTGQQHVDGVVIEAMREEAQRQGWLPSPSPEPPPEPPLTAAAALRAAHIQRRKAQARLQTTGKLLVEMADDSHEYQLPGLRDPDPDFTSQGANTTTRNMIARWEDEGAPAYVISDDLAEALAQTDAPLDMRGKDLPWPAPAFYFEFESHALYLGDGAIHGFLVEAPRGDCIYLAMFGYSLKGGQFHCLSDLLAWEQSFQVMLGQEGVVRDDEGDDEGVNVTFDEEVVATLINVVFYLAYRPTKKDKVDETRSGAVRRAEEKKNPKKRKKLLRAANHLSGYTRYVVHLDEPLKVFKGGRGGGPVDRGGVRLHHVKGHWRTFDPEKNPRWSELRATWIKPHLRGDAALGVIDKIYSDSPKKAKRALESRTPEDDDEGSGGLSGV